MRRLAETCQVLLCSSCDRTIAACDAEPCRQPTTAVTCNVVRPCPHETVLLGNDELKLEIQKYNGILEEIREYIDRRKIGIGAEYVHRALINDHKKIFCELVEAKQLLGPCKYIVHGLCGRAYNGSCGCKPCGAVRPCRHDRGVVGI